MCDQRPAACASCTRAPRSHVHDRVVPLVAGVLEQVARSHPPPRLVRRHREADGPRPGEADRVGDRRFVVDRAGIDSREPLDYTQTRGRRAPDVAEPILRPIRKVAALDHQGVPVPPASRLTVPPRDAGPRAAVDDAAHMVHFVPDHHVGRRLEDLVVRVVAEPDLGQPVAEAPLPRVEVEVRVPGGRSRTAARGRAPWACRGFGRSAGRRSATSAHSAAKWCPRRARRPRSRGCRRAGSRRPPRPAPAPRAEPAGVPHGRAQRSQALRPPPRSETPVPRTPTAVPAASASSRPRFPSGPDRPRTSSVPPGPRRRRRAPRPARPRRTRTTTNPRLSSRVAAGAGHHSLGQATPTSPAALPIPVYWNRCTRLPS